MESCNFRAPNGENSLLFVALEQLVGTEKATVIWNQVYSEEFKLQYGDWQNQFSIVNAGVNKIWAINTPSEALPEEIQQDIKGLDVTDHFTIKYENGKFNLYTLDVEYFPKFGLKVNEQGVLIPGIIDLKKDLAATLYIEDVSKNTLKTILLLSDAKDKFEDELSDEKIPTDPNGEPTFAWVKEKLNLDQQQLIQAPVVKDYKNFAEAKEAWRTGKGIWTMRPNKDVSVSKGEHFGNPFSPQKEQLTPGTIIVSSTAEAVQAYSDWLSGKAYQEVEPERRKWILESINSGKLDGKTLIYYKPSKYKSHADALVELVQNRMAPVSTPVATTWVKEKLKLHGQSVHESVHAQSVESKVITLDDIKKTSEESVVASINKLYDESEANPTVIYRFNLPGNNKEKIRLGNKTSISVLKLATIIDSRAIPYNIKFSNDFMSVLENTPKRYLSNVIYQEQSIFSPTIYDEKLFEQQLAENFVPVRNNDGSKTGAYFDAERQSEVADSIVLMMYTLMTKEDVQRAKRSKISSYANDILTRFSNTQAVYAQRGDEKLAHELQLIINSFDIKDGLSFWKLAIQRLNDYGIKIKGDNIEESKPNTLPSDKLIDKIVDDIFGEVEGYGLSDWSDNHFEHDPKDTASARIKYFMATVFDSEVGEERQPQKIGLPFNNPETRSKIIKGQKILTVRSQEQVDKLNLPTRGEFTASIESELYRVTYLRQADQSDVEANATNIEKEEGTVMKVGDHIYTMERYVPKENMIRTNVNYVGMPKLVNFEQLYNDTMGALADQEKSIENYIAILRSAGNQFKPNLRALADKLEKAPKNIQNEFVSVMSLHYNQFTMVLLDQKMDTSGKPYYILRPINANRGSQINMIKENWRQNQKFAQILSRNAAGITVINQEKAAELKSDLDTVNALYAKSDKTAQAKAEELMKKTFEYNGITMPDKAIAEFVKNTSQWTKKTTVAGNFRGQFGVNEKGQPQGIISVLILKLAGRVDENDEEAEDDRSFTFNNPLYTEETSMNILGRLAAAYTPSLYSNTHKSSEKKTIYDYGFHSSLTRSIRRLQLDEAYRSKFDETEISRNSFLLTRLNNNETLRNKIGISYLDGLKVVYKPNAEGIVRPKMSDREQLLTVLALFQNRGNKEFAHYVSLTHADKSMTPILENMPRIENVTTTKTGIDKLSGLPSMVPVFSEEVYTEMFNVFHSEYDRIHRAAQHDYNNPKYQEGSQHFFFLPEFNYDRLSAAVKKGEVPEGVLEALYTDKKLNNKEYPKFKDAVRLLIVRRMNDLATTALNEWKKNKIIADADKIDNVPFDRKYLNRLLRAVGIRYQRFDSSYESLEAASAAGLNTKGGDFVDQNGGSISDSAAYNLAATLAARDYAVNSFLMNVSMSQLLYGDPAQVWKGSVEETMVEYGKRLAKDIAPGREGAFAPDEPYLTVTVKDFKTNAKYLAEFELLRSAYNDKTPIEASDAQELTTVQEHIYVMYKLGRISQETYHEMKDIIDEANGGYYEFTEEHHKDVIMQPMKPVYAGDRDVYEGAILNDYIKSSAYALYPPMTAGKELDKVRVAMEKGKIARLNFSSAKKIGGPNNPVELFDADGAVNEKIFDASEWTGVDKKGNRVPSARQILSRDNFRIQQEVPYDETKESIRTVSQMNKLITEGISQMDTEFTFGEQKLSAPQLIAAKEDIRKKLFDINKTKLYDEIGVVLKDNKIHFQDRKKLFKAVRKRILQGNTDFTANDLAYVQQSNVMNESDELIIPLMFAPSASKFELMLMSMINEISNIEMPGKSYIQSSPAGHQTIKKFEDMTDVEKKNITWVEGYDGGALKILRHDKDGNALAAQVLVSFDFVLNGRRLNILKYTKQTEDGRTVIDHDKLPKELLQLIGARIPNQGHNSMLPMEIVGFLPTTMGDLMIVPAAITKQMGSDFDVDKLYTYHRSFVSKNGKLKVADGIAWTSTEKAAEVPSVQPDISLTLIPRNQLNKNVKTTVIVEETGEEMETEVSAKEWHNQIKQDFKTIKELLACLG